MEDIALKDWVAIVSSIGTFISSIIVLVTLFELRKQRKQSYMPDLVTSDICFDYNNEPEQHVKMWCTDDNEFLSLKFSNVGLGVAKNISFKWNFDIHEMIEKFYNLSNSDDSDLYLDSDENRLYYKQHGELVAGSSLSIDDRRLDFLLPYENNQNNFKLELPNSFLTISAAIYKNSYKHKIFDENSFENTLAPLTLSIKYKDVGGSIINKKLNIKVSFFTKSVNRNQQPSEYIKKMRGRVYVSEF
ncbi:hypothetical protein ORJ66_18145 [Pseudoalteromonas tunicata]|uniref:hypothetical protein n=1 Tax=Pseudoalteromonas tunicata TaxID=314281 RepID=UPI00273F187F|nr:hypothetical protein [Pseudoalteromonas tunicata]MDP5214977.1 hypothetical protein [Pseudoalteromonas tunicata]